MQSELLSKIGINYIDPVYLIIVLLVIIIGMIIYVSRVNRKMEILYGKYRKFMSGKDAKSLENVVSKRFKQMDDLLIFDRETNKKIDNLNEFYTDTYQKLGIVKYDAFNEMGGKLSFALCLLNKNNTGFILNSMHSREGCYMYIKEIISGKSAVLLGDEEKEALDKAVNSDNYME